MDYQDDDPCYWARRHDRDRESSGRISCAIARAPQPTPVQHSDTLDVRAPSDRTPIHDDRDAKPNIPACEYSRVVVQVLSPPAVLVVRREHKRRPLRALQYHPEMRQTS